MTILPSKDVEALRLHGWVALRGSNAIEVEDVVVRLARQLGEPTPSRKGRGCVDRLAPVATDRSHPRSLSRMFGIGAFPLHTDTAHWPVPSRFIVLGCVSPGASNRPTLLQAADNLNIGSSERRLLSEGVFLVRNGRRSFYSAIFPANQPYIRFDSGCMSPVTESAHRGWQTVLQRIAAATPIHIPWRSGDVLVIDNWRTLHGRGDATDDDDRVLIRVLVRADHSPWEQL
jgi:alpha-ketoglutarate-dependent taurine dioxygenase